MKILVIEHSDHFSLLGHLDNIIGNEHQVSYMFKDLTNKCDWKKMFHPAGEVIVIESRFRLTSTFRFFSKILKEGRKADIVILNTGPEYSSPLSTVLSFFVYLPYKSKVIYTVRNPSRSEYDSNNNSFRVFFLRLLIGVASGYFYESKTVKNAIEKTGVIKASKPGGIIYTRAPSQDFQVVRSALVSNRLVVGVLGTVNISRRDYQLLLRSLRLLRSNDIEVKLVFLGAAISSEGKSVVAEFKREFEDIYAIDGWLSEIEFLQMGSMCDLLIAPLLDGFKQYGNGGSTGAFGDAIALRKNLAIPAFADPEREFQDFSYYYNDDKDLFKILVNLDADLLHDIITKPNLSRFDLKTISWEVATVFKQVLR